jgi:hypothetical protein
MRQPMTLGIAGLRPADARRSNPGESSRLLADANSRREDTNQCESMEARQEQDEHVSYFFFTKWPEDRPNTKDVAQRPHSGYRRTIALPNTAAAACYVEVA